MSEPVRLDAPLVLTMGEPAGVGAEIACMAWHGRNADDQPFFLIDDAARVADLSKRLALDAPVREIAAPVEATEVWRDALPVLSRPLAQAVEPGRPDPANAPMVIGAIDAAIALVQSGEACAMVTNPIQKGVLYEAGFHLPGHTEYLAERTGATSPPVMLLAAPGLRVALVTIHLPLAEAIAALTADAIVATATIVAAGLRRDFGIDRPRLVIAGLNPHAGEAGSLGREEIEIITPAVEALQRAGIGATGPFPADTLFHAEARRHYDAAICMYHDQALIPLKTIDFWRGVNITLGLPIVRTSPDHGTALDLAGTGRANPESLLAALRTARDIARHRRAAVTRVPDTAGPA
jgi:4-hydroxythreonine-4-phosphate dehydrogenase